MRLRVVLAGLTALALIVAGCGDSDDTDDTSGAGETTAVAETTATPGTTAGSETTAPAETTTAPPTSTGGDPPEDWPESLVFGFVPSQEQEQLQDDIQPFVDVLESALGLPVEGVVTTDYTGLVTAMGAGQADLGAFGPFGYVLGRDQFGNIEALIQSIRFGSATYHGQWFTDDSSLCVDEPQPATALENVDGEIVQVPAVDAVALQVGVTATDDGKELGATASDGTEISPGTSCLGDLSRVEGRKVAFTTESSTSGYLFPALQLTDLGIDPTSDVEAVFTGGHDAAVTAVYNGDADAGLSFDDARGTISDEQPDVGERVIVFSITTEIPNDVVAVRSDLPQSLKDAVYDAVESYLETDEGQAVFDEIYQWTDIQRADEADFDVVRQAARTLGITEPPE